ncbi:MAG TPA: flavodoxin domain-containing protein [Desulfopila sp.]|nr:flavodoxin domain-containing protein [Desulfopila sp.]
MSKALIVYATRNGETEKIADIIAEGIRLSLAEVSVCDVKKIKNAEEIAGYDAYVFGSSTYHGEMMTTMKTFLFLAEQAELKDKIGGTFGSYGWSGEAATRIFDTMKNIYGMNMVGAPLMLKTVSIEGGLKAAQDYGREIGERLAVGR